MTAKAVFWDMDGTLVDSEPLHTHALELAMLDQGITPPPDLHDRVLGVSAYPVYVMLRDELGLDLPFDTWIERKYEKYLPKAATLQPRQGALEIWRDLDARGVAQAVVSNSDRMIVEANLRAVGLTRPGLRTVSRNDVRLGKPDPEPFLRAAWLVGVDPAECFVVEDSQPGAMAGVAAGMTALFWPQLDIDPPAGAQAVGTAAELRAALGID